MPTLVQKYNRQSDFYKKASGPEKKRDVGSRTIFVGILDVNHDWIS